MRYEKPEVKDFGSIAKHTYDNPGAQPVFFGEATEDEMCFNFVMVYPVEAIGENRQCGVL